MPRLVWTKETIIKAVESFVLKNGRFPTTKELDSESDLPSRSIFPTHFGITYSEWRKKNDDQYSYVDEQFKQMELDHLKYWLKNRLIEMGTTSLKEYDKRKRRHEPSEVFIRSRITNWKQFLIEVGLLDETYYNKETTINKFINFHHDLGFTPSSNETKDHDKRLFLSIMHHFGSYNEFLDELSLKHVRGYEFVEKSDEELLDDYLKLCDQLGKLATLKEISSCKWIVSSETYLTRFGSIKKVRRLLGLDEGLKQKKRYSRKMLEEKIRRIIDDFGKDIPVNEFYKQLGCAKTTLAKHFNTTSVKKIIRMVDEKE